MEGSAPLVPTNPADALAYLASAPTVAKGLAGLTIVLSLGHNLIPGLQSVLAIKATNTYGAHSYIWNVFTAGFYNTNLLLACVVAFSFILMGRFLKGVWGSGDFVRFLCFSNLCTGICIFICQIVAYMTTFNYKYLEQPISGGMGIIAAFTVTIKQQLPEEPIKVFGQHVMNIRAKDSPGILVILAAFLSITEIAPIFIQCVCGSYFGWLYLRFVQRGADGLRGDMSDHMAFIMFFPPVLRPLAQVVSSSAYKLVCGKTLQSMLDDIPTSRSGGGLPTTQAVVRGIMEGNANFSSANSAPAPPLPGSNPADAERRRARALKTLEERLRSITQDTPGATEHLTKTLETNLDASLDEEGQR